MVSKVLSIEFGLVLLACMSPMFDFNQRNPTLVISIDGLRQQELDDFLNVNINSYLRKEFEDIGVKADFMTPTFPSMKFPNHFSMSTGEIIF